VRIRKPSLNIVTIILVGTILPIVLGTLFGVVVYSGTINRANSLASNSLSQTAYNELKTTLNTQTEILDDFFRDHELEIIQANEYLENMVEFTNTNTNFNFSRFSQNEDGIRGLETDIGFGDVFVFPEVEMNSTINNTIEYLSLGAPYFHSIVNSTSVVHAYFSTQKLGLSFHTYSEFS
jgi:hypothetical protein